MSDQLGIQAVGIYSHFKEVMCDTKKTLNISYLYSEAEETDPDTPLHIF